MGTKELEERVKREFNNAVCLMGLIPFLAFVYIISVRLASPETLTGDIGYIVSTTLALLFLGIIAGRKLFWSMITKLIDFNVKNEKLQKDLVEKKRLAAITETTLALGHEINNPLILMRGNLELLEADFTKENVPQVVKEKFKSIKESCDRIGHATERLSKISKPKLTTIKGNTRMVDLEKSE